MKETMKNIQTFGSLFLAMLSCWTLGTYSSSTFKYDEPVDPHKWIMTSLFGLMFLVFFLDDYRKK